MDTPEHPEWLERALMAQENIATALSFVLLTEEERKALTSVAMGLRPIASAPSAYSTPRAFLQWCEANRESVEASTDNAEKVVIAARTALKARKAQTAVGKAQAMFGAGCAIAHPSRVGRL